MMNCVQTLDSEHESRPLKNVSADTGVRLRAALIQIPFSIRSERQLMEQMQYNLLFRWFVGLGIDDPAWVATVFTKNRDRLLSTHIARKFLGAILAHKDVAPLLSDEHFSVDGTLIEAWASMKSFQPKPDGAEPPSGESGSGGRRAKSAGEGRNAEAKAYAQKQLGAVDAIEILARPMHRGAGYRLADMVQHVGFA